MEENEDKVGQKAKEVAKDSAKKVTKTTGKVAKKTLKEAIKLVGKTVAKLASFLFTKVGLIILAIVIVVLIIIAVFTYFLKGEDSDKVTGTGKFSINTILKINDISELVTINGTPKGGYSLAFIDDIDEKLEEVIKSDKQYEGLGIKDVDILKNYIKAELVTQLPYLGEGVPKNKLPNLDGVDILSEPLENEDNYKVGSMEGFLMLGDSITHGIHLTRMLSECEFRYQDGKDAKYWIDNFSLLPNKATGVCVMLGVNGPVASNMKNLIDKLCEKYEDRPIYVQKVLPLGVNYTAGYVTQDQIDSYNNEIKKYCEKKENVYWIDTSDGYVDETGHLKNSSDGLHPNDYKTLVTNIKNKIISGRGNSSNAGTQLTGANDEEKIWSYLINEGFSEVAVAAIMGNWAEESSLDPLSVQGNYAQSDPATYNREYTNNVDTKQISKNDFINNGPRRRGIWISSMDFSRQKETDYTNMQ